MLDICFIILTGDGEYYSSGNMGNEVFPYLPCVGDTICLGKQGTEMRYFRVEDRIIYPTSHCRMPVLKLSYVEDIGLPPAGRPSVSVSDLRFPKEL